MAQARIVEPVAQFGLAHQDNLQQFAFVGFQVGEQAHLFEQLPRQILRFVNNQDGILAVFDLLQEEAVDFGHRFQAVQALDLQIQLHGDGLHQLIGVQHRIKNQRGGKGRAEFFQQGAAKGGLARADLAGQLDKALPFAHPVKQMIKGLAMLGAEKQKPRIRCNIERRFLQPVVFQVHGYYLTHGGVGGKIKCQRRFTPAAAG